MEIALENLSKEDLIKVISSRDQDKVTFRRYLKKRRKDRLSTGTDRHVQTDAVWAEA